MTIKDSEHDMVGTYGGFAKFLTQFLFENGLSKKEFADLMGVTPSAVTHWADGSSVPKKKAEDIARKIQDLSGNSVKAADVIRLIG